MNQASTEQEKLFPLFLIGIRNRSNKNSYKEENFPLKC
jgi:hypothetical protein